MIIECALGALGGFIIGLLTGEVFAVWRDTAARRRRR